MKGYLLLTSHRSGSTWLTSLANESGEMGNCEEWLTRSHLDAPAKSYTQKTHFSMVLSKAERAGRFGVKIMPAELHRTYYDFGYDFIKNCASGMDTLLVSLERRDLVAQAISLTRALQTRAWRSTDQTKSRDPVYDFRKICWSLQYIARSAQFWKVYQIAAGIDIRTFYYEDLFEDPSPFLEHLADHFGVEIPSEPLSRLAIQRDELTIEWRDRFEADAGKTEILDILHGREPAARTLGNLGRFLRKEQTKPFPFHLMRDKTI